MIRDFRYPTPLIQTLIFDCTESGMQNNIIG